MANLKFTELKLSEEMQKALKFMGFEEASPIQSKAIPLVMEGQDIIGQAQTGTGKTAAFGIPAIENLDLTSKDLQVLVLCPTRELVVQVSEEFKKMMQFKKGLNIVPVYGGQQIDRQLKPLKKGAQIVIGTPGRTMDHIQRGSIDMSKVKMVVLDEADEMLDMGFRDDIQTILEDTPENRQTVMFSATMEKEILKLTKTYMNNPTVVNVVNEHKSELKIDQSYFEVMSKNKAELLCRLIDLYNIKLSVVFCNTKTMVDELVETLKTKGYFADGLHGDMNQRVRDKVMNGFRNGAVEILVATDVAGRGIDVSNIEAVFNYDLPRDDEDYVHRVGRTGRAGKTGRAFTFVSGRQVTALKRIEKANGVQILRENIPTIKDLEQTRFNCYASKIAKVLQEGNLEKYTNQIEQLVDENSSPLEISAALLKMVLEKETETFDESVDFGELEKVANTRKRSNSRNKKYSGFYGKNSRKDNNKSNRNWQNKDKKKASFGSDRKHKKSKTKNSSKRG